MNRYRVLQWLATLAACVVLVGLAGCGTLTDRRERQAELIRAAGWQSQIIPTDRFDVAAAFPAHRSGDTLVIYLEGDGRAYIDAYRPASDPTPTDPLALRLALADPRAGPVAYLARPCQYVMPDHDRNCRDFYWTTGRYAPEIVDSIGQAVDRLKRDAQALRVVLVGYSGGGALAVLLAQRRKDIAGIVTVAGNLDLAYWAGRDGLSPLSGSLDPAQDAVAVAALPQVHFAGGKDTTVGPDVVRAFLHHLPSAGPERLIVIPEFDHFCCWGRQWPALLKRPELALIPAMAPQKENGKSTLPERQP